MGGETTMITKSLTAKIKIVFLNKEDKSRLEITSKKYKDGCNFVSRFIFDNNFLMHQVKLNNAVYHDLRKNFNLKSQMAQSVIRTVIARYRTTRQQLQSKPFKYKDLDGKWKQTRRTLEWMHKPIYFKRNQLDLVANRDWSYSRDNGTLSLNTTSGRIKVKPIVVGFEQYFDGSWKYGTAKVLKIKNDWFLHLAVTKEMPAFNNDVVKHVVGIDRGLRVLAATYDECGNANFFDGKKVMARRNNYKRLRAELQAKGTKSAKRKLKNISGRENRWMTDVNHSITKTLVERYGHNTLFVVEDLTDIRFNSNELGESLRSAVNSWAFGQFEQFLSYKASCNQSEVIRVSPRYTSQRCPKCGVIDKTNRNHKLHEYHCKDCLYRSNDDRVAAMNIQELGKRYLSGENKPKFKK